MRTIHKGQEPRSLTEHRRSSRDDFTADYENYREKDDLRASLAAEQGYICCYCMQRIRPTREGMKVEHWHCQSNYGDEQLRYGNLLGACLGNKGQPRTYQHCDTYKEDADLSRNPAEPSHRVEELVQYLGNGCIVSSNGEFDREMNEVLNLNHPYLVEGRKKALEGFKMGLSKRGTIGKDTLNRMIEKLCETTGSKGLEPFCGVIVYWLRKRLARI